MKQSRKFIFALLPFVLITTYILFKDSLPEYTSNNGLVSDEIIPSGWYPHTFGTSTVLFTRSRFLPRIEGTEGYAYGEQIVVGVSPYDGEQGKEETWYQIEWINQDDEYSNLNKEWSTLNGHKVLRLMYDGMTNGADLSYLVFNGGTVHTVSLYPAYNSSHLEIFEVFFTEYTKSLNLH